MSEEVKYQIIRSFGPSVFKITIPKSIIEILNNYTHILVPNNYNKLNFIDQGLTTKIDVLPLFCDSDHYVYKEPQSKNKFVFGISNEDPRKNLTKVTKCFLKAFKGCNDGPRSAR
mgnify:CR=1 FL=1